MGAVGALQEGQAGEAAVLKCSCGAVATTRCPAIQSWHSSPCCEPCLKRRQRATRIWLIALHHACLVPVGIWSALDGSWGLFSVMLASYVVGWLPLRQRRPRSFLGLVFGKHSSPALRGFVADRCTECACVRTFKVLDHYSRERSTQLPRFAKYERSSRACVACRTEHAFDESEYDRVLEWKELEGVSMERGVRTTNRRLAELLKVADRLRELHDGPAYRSSDQDRDALNEATKRFERLVYEMVDLEPIAARLERWRELTPHERTELVAELRDLGYPLPRFRIETPPIPENVADPPEPEPEAEVRLGATSRVR